MTDELRIPISTPGAAAAKKNLAAIAAGERDVGRAAETSGRKAAGAGQAAAGGMDAAEKKTRKAKRAMDDWGNAGKVAAGAVIAAFTKVVARMQEVNARLRDTYREFVGLTQQAETIALAQVRGASERKTALWLETQGQRFGLAPENVRGAAFGIESGLKPGQVGGQAALGQIETAAFQTMRAFGAGGKTMSSLTIAGYEAGLAKTPEQFRQFYAKAGAYAGGSAMTMQDLGGIMGRLLPLAVKAGIDPDYFMAQAAAMSYRIAEPGALGTALMQLIRAAGKKSKPLQQFAAGQGRAMGDLSAREIMEFQSEFVSRGLAKGGPVGGEEAATQLELPPELGQVYGAAFDPAVQARMGGLMQAGRGARWGPVVGQRFRGMMGTAEARYTSEDARGRVEKLRRSAEESDYHAATKYAGAEVARMLRKGDTGWANRVREYAMGEEGMGRAYLHELVTGRLTTMIHGGGARGRQAAGMLDAIDDYPLAYAQFGVAERDDMIKAVQFLEKSGMGFPNTFQGGTHYHNNDKREPAGRRREPAAPR